MSDNVSGRFAVTLRLGSRPGSLQFLLGLLGRLREGESEPDSEDQAAHCRGPPGHNISPVVKHRIFPVMSREAFPRPANWVNNRIVFHL